ncbi:MAG: glycosyltransferase family 2 protein [Lachnospiraceae bacterium]|nr:glycosyltransferase family 2 protein [Lachnospiraceae bacterium]
MIVKNEEAFLKRCLDCVVNLMDEIIIVDTGSTDKTKEIAKEYTDKIYDYEWCDDFADARNFAFSKASMDYIYSCDADEVIDDTNRMRFMNLKTALVPEVEIVQMHYVEATGSSVLNAKSEYRPKLYKRLRGFTWIEPIHETVRLDPVVFDSDIEILHKPATRHSKRDFHIFEKAYNKDKYLSDNLISMYAKELLKCGDAKDFEKAAEIFEEVMLNQKITEEQLIKVSCVLAHNARIRDDETTFLKYTTKVLVSKPCSEICLELGEYFLENQDNDEAIVWFYNAAYETEPILDILSQGKAPRLGLAQCYANIAKDLGYNDFTEDTATNSDTPQDVSAILELHKRYLNEAMNWDVPDEQE